MSRLTAIAATALLLAPLPAHAEHWSKAFVADWLEPAFYYDGPKADFLGPGSDCPKGTSLGPDVMDLLKTLWRGQDELTYYKDAENHPDMLRVLRFRGPKFEDVWANPTTVADTHTLPPVSGNVGYGFDLDGKVKPADFTSPDGIKGIDNNYYRAAGCWLSYRAPAFNGERPLSNNGHMRDGLYTILIVISGDQSPTDDDNATLAFYQSPDKIVKDSGGQVAHDASFAIQPSLRNQSVLKAKIHNGVVETTSPQEIRVRDEAWNSGSPDQIQLTQGQFRFKLGADGGLEGLFGGYRDWKVLYRRQSASARDTETLRGISLPDFYYALERYADADPDPVTGKNRRISVAYHLRAVPAFVLTPDYSQAVQTARLFDQPPAARSKLAQAPAASPKASDLQ